MSAPSPWGQPQQLPPTASVSSYSAMALLGERAKPQPVRRDIVAAPIEALRIWQVIRPTELSLTKGRVEEMAAAFDAGRNPFAGLFGARLCGVGMNETWARPVMEATCAHGHSQAVLLATAQSRYLPSQTEGHDAPAERCSCGVWALKDDEAVTDALINYTGSRYAYGRVQMWGRIYEHKRGYRAQYARPLDITVIDGDDETILDLAAFYGCPVRGGPMPEGVNERRQALAMQQMELYKQQLSAGASYPNPLTMMYQPPSPPKPKRWWST